MTKRTIDDIGGDPVPEWTEAPPEMVEWLVHAVSRMAESHFVGVEISPEDGSYIYTWNFKQSNDIEVPAERLAILDE